MGGGQLLNKKAFTLIELLAVIVILAIIALIATPIILNIIEDARKESEERSVELYASAIKNAIMTEQLNGPMPKTIEDINLEDYYTGDVSCETTKIYADGTIYLAECTVNGTLLEDYKYGIYQVPSVICTAVITSLTGNVPAGNYAKGDEYVCEVAEGKSYNFFVLSTNGDNVNLIMDSNINEAGEPIKEASPTDKGLVAWDSSGDNSNGPRTAIERLNTATASWTNLTSLNETYNDEGSHFTNFALTGKARMPRYDEVVGDGLCQLYNGGAGYGSCPLWLANYLNSTSHYTTNKTNVSGVSGYWTLSSDTSYSTRALYVHSSGDLNYAGVGSYSLFGVRPVITISKSKLS